MNLISTCTDAPLLNAVVRFLTVFPPIFNGLCLQTFQVVKPPEGLVQVKFCTIWN
jgi:hypothetical protein